MKDNNEEKAWAFIWSGIIISYLLIAIFLICWSLMINHMVSQIIEMIMK